MIDVLDLPHTRVMAGCMASCFFAERLGASLAVPTAILHMMVVADCLPRVASRFARCVSLRDHARLASMYVLVSAANSALAALHIDMPFQIVFRSSSVMFSMLCGRLFYGMAYSARKSASCVLLSVGVLLATPFDGRGAVEHNAEWIAGVGLMLASSVVSALMGHEQRKIYAKAPQNDLHACSDEIMLVSHALGTVSFLSAGALSHSAAPGVGDWAVAISHHACMLGVYDLVAKHGGLHCTFVLAVRKFASLVLSIVYFGNSFSLVQCLGAACVIAGTSLFYSDYRTTSAAIKNK